MKNRQPRYPGRVSFTLDVASATLLGVPAGTVLGGVWTRNDDPYEAGDPINKFSLLKDETAKMLGGDPETMVPDDALQMLAALASSGGGGSGDVGELEDLAVKVGRLTNAGAGWNTYRFPEPFDAAPQAVLLQPVDFTGWAEVRNITAEGFLYCLRQPVYTEGNVSTGTYYTANGANPTLHYLRTLVDGVTLPTAENKTIADAVEVVWLAIEYNGGDQ